MLTRSVAFKNDTPGAWRFLFKCANFILKINISCGYKSYTINYGLCNLEGVVLRGLLMLTLDALIKLPLISRAIVRIAKPFLTDREVLNM